MPVITVTVDNFENEVENCEKPVLLDFWASWCGPCKMVSPVVEEIADEHPEYQVCKVNVDEEMELAARFRIMSIPTLVAMKDGKFVKKLIGYHTKEQILEMLQSV